MSLARFKSQNHPEQVASRGPNEEVDDRATTPALFAALEQRFGKFTLDVAASRENAKCLRFFTREDDGLSKTWCYERVWCNPPYSNIRPWVEKAWAEAGCAKSIVMILPANRTEQSWWQEEVEPFRDRDDRALRVEFIASRIRFIKKGKTSVGPNERPPFGCCLLIWSNER